MKHNILHSEPYLLLSKLKEVLGYKDMRSVIEWCEKNGVYIMHQGNRQLVNSTEFLLSFYKPFIRHLKLKHKDWKERFIDYIEGNITNLLSCSKKSETVVLVQNPIHTKKKNSSFLQKLKDL